MSFWSKIFTLNRQKEKEQEITIKASQGELTISKSEELQPSPDERIEEFWIETIGVSEDGYWVMVGRRHGIVQLYDWKGRIHRMPARPPAQVVSEIVFSGRFLGLLTPPYLVVYQMEDPHNPVTWKSFKLSQEGIRPSIGLDIKEGLLAFGVVGERVYAIDVASDLSLQTVDFKSTFSYKDDSIGDLKSIKILNHSKLLLSGSQGCAIYTLSGNIVKKIPVKAGRAVCVKGNSVYLGDGNRLIVYDQNLDTQVASIDTPIDISSVDVDASESFAFLADAERNVLGVADLKAQTFLERVEGFGYSVVKVSPDGSIYTSYHQSTQDLKLYYFVKLSSNLVDFYYTKDRKERIIKTAQDVYKKLTKSISTAKNPKELYYIKEYQELKDMDMPIREVREIIEKAQEGLKRRDMELFVEEIKQKITAGSISREDLKYVEERLRENPTQELQRLKDSILEYFSKTFEEKLRSVSLALSKAQATRLQDLELLPEVKDVRDFVSSMPKELYQTSQERLSKLLQEKVVKERLERFKIVLFDDKVVFGKEEFPKFSGERRRLKWRIRTEDRLMVEGREYVRLAFEREDGIIVEPKRYPSILDVDKLKHTPEWIRRYLRHLNNLHPYQEYRLPLMVSYEETPWFVENLERFTSLVKEQLLYHDGIVILEGDAGVGKNFLVEVFAILTKRPLYIVPCNSKMEKEDLTFVYEFDPKRGTRRVYSDLVKALQTPGAIVYLDEINTLPASLVKIFNPLFDYRRYLVLSSGEVIKAHKDVILVGGMNPQNYLGVSELPQDIKSRADIIFIDYPPFEKDGNLYHPDEALILRDYIKAFAGLTKEEFTYLWHYVINGIQLDIPKELATQERIKFMHLLFELIKIANTVRSAYRAYQMQQSEEPVEFVFSIRDTIRCARRLDKYQDSKAVVLDTILPKVSSPLEKEIIKSIVERT